MAKILLVTLILLSSCADPKAMTNTEIIAASKECIDAGFDVAVVSNIYNFDTVKIICKPPKPQESK